MIHLFQNYSSSRVEQNGHLSEQITLACGLGKVTPSHHMYWICVWILCVDFVCELNDAFTFGPIYLDRIIEATSNKFWIDVIKSIQMLWQSEAVWLWLHDNNNNNNNIIIIIDI